MKRSRMALLLSLMIVTSLVFGTQAFAQVNLLVNPGFEASGGSYDGWMTFGNGPNISTPADDDIYRSGVAAAKIYGEFSNCPDYPVFDVGGVYQAFTPTPGTEYELSGYTLVSSADTIPGFDTCLGNRLIAKIVFFNAAVGGVTNPADDADPGRLRETDVDFRIRRQVELFGGNVGGLAAIRAVVSRVEGVTSVRVYHNPATPGVDADGIPFKAANVVVETNPTPPPVALQEAIADSILSSLGAGGEAFGTDFSLTRPDSEGVLQPVAFDLISEVDVFVKITVDTTGTEHPVSVNLAAVVAETVLEKAQSDFSGIGQNQLGFQYSAIVSELQESGEISGVVSVLVELSRVALVGPYADPVEIGIRERPSFESVNVDVVVLP